jgi:hypothetical protein
MLPSGNDDVHVICLDAYIGTACIRACSAILDGGELAALVVLGADSVWVIAIGTLSECWRRIRVIDRLKPWSSLDKPC